MRDFRQSTSDRLRQKWLESVYHCNCLFGQYNDLCDAIEKFDIDVVNQFDCRVYKQLIDKRLVVESELVSARVACRRAYDDYFFEFPFLAAFDKADMIGGDTD